MQLNTQAFISKQMMIKIYGTLLFGYILTACQAQSSTDNHKSDSLIQVYQKRLDSYLLKDTASRDFIALHENGIYIFENKAQKGKNQAEFELLWQDLPQFKALLQNEPYKALEQYLSNSKSINMLTTQPSNPSPTGVRGLRIALDPGHIAGDMPTARMEGKFITMTLKDGTKIQFWESQLAWYTARILQTELEKRGAIVMLTRKEAHLSAFDTSYDTWYAENIPTEKGKKSTENDKQTAFLRTFRKAELIERTRKINEFKPHLTLIIHYNVDATNTAWKQPTSANNSMAFVGGAFVGKDLENKEDRFHLLRLLLSEDWVESVSFSYAVLNALQTRLKIAPIAAQNNQSFLNQNCLPTAKEGVYCRNLTLSKQVIGVTCYAEPLYQDNEQECRLLNQRDFVFEGKKIPARINAVAQSYLQGILAYCKQ